MQVTPGKIVTMTIALIFIGFPFRNECTALEGNLTSIHSKEENDFVFNLLEPNSESSYYGLTWLGASCVRSVCKWDDGTPWDFESWKPGV